ncbi:MAG: GLUG motif-containing protein [Solibacillus isronensis]
MANGLFGGGDGTELNPHLVEDAQDLDAVRNDMSAHYKQTKDIDLTLIESWPTIGGTTTAFTGVFDGNNKKIKNFSMNNQNGNGGLFCYLDNGGKLLNITLTNVNVVTYDRNGSLVAYITNNSEVRNCHMAGSVTHTRTGVYRIGGLIGYANKGSIVADCTAKGIVTAESQFGGLIGYIESGAQLIRCAAYSEVICESGYGGNTGILVGGVYSEESVVDSCYAEGTVQSQSSTGGLAGYNGGTIRNSMVKGVVDINNWNGSDYADDFGGIAGYNSGTVENCLSLCSFKREGKSSTIGALVGDNNVGKDYEGTIISSYYGNYLDGVADIENGIGTPLTEAQVKDVASYEGWDFELLWSFGEDAFPIPTFALPPKPEEPTPIPKIDFRKTKMLRDMLGVPIPQVWHATEMKWVPVTNQNFFGGGGGNTVEIGKATTEELGLVRFDGRTIISDEDGVLTAVIPIAAAKLLGGIKPDDQTIFVDSETGVASAPRNVHTSNRSPLPEEGRDGDLWVKYKEVE